MSKARAVSIIVVAAIVSSLSNQGTAQADSPPPMPEMVQIAQAASPAPVATPNTVSPSTPAPTPSPFPNQFTKLYFVNDQLTALSNSQDQVAKDAVALIGQGQHELEDQFGRRGLRVLQAADEIKAACESDTSANIIAFHWTLNTSPALGAPDYLTGVATAVDGMAYHYEDCLSKEIAVNGRPSDYGSAIVYQAHVPLDFISALLGLASLFKPSGKNLVAASLVGGVSAVGGAVNGIGNAAYKGADPVKLSQQRAAWTIANDYCNRNIGVGHIDCRAVKRP